MSFLRSLRRHLDPWAAVLLGVFVTLALVIILATPGPWHQVVGGRGEGLASAPPSDIVVFVTASRGAECTGVVWAHVDHERLSLTATVVPALTTVSVAGGGEMTLNRAFDDLGEEAAAQALQPLLGVDIGMAIALDEAALPLALPSAFNDDGSRAHRKLTLATMRAWRAGQPARSAWVSQHNVLQEALPGVSFAELNVVAFANYILGFGPPRPNLDLQAVSALGATLRQIQPYAVRVRACRPVVARCLTGERWRLDQDVVAQLRRDLDYGITPSLTTTAIKRDRRAARILVVNADRRLASVAYGAALGKRLSLRAGGRVEVRVVDVATPAGERNARRQIAEWRPLVVVVAPTTAAGLNAARVSSLSSLAAYLGRRRSAALLVAPEMASAQREQPADEEATRLMASYTTSELPIAVWQRGGVPALTGRRKAARAAEDNAETLVRAYWQQSLAPRLSGTRRGASLAARRQIRVSVVGDSTMAASVMTRLRVFGYSPELIAPSEWVGVLPAPGQPVTVLARASESRVAGIVGGDLGVKPSHSLSEGDKHADVVVLLPVRRAETALGVLL